MANECPRLFCDNTRAEFLQHLRDHPTTRRIPRTEEINIVGWLLNPELRPATQEEFSRRNFVRRKFAWDTNKQKLVAVAGDVDRKDREVVVEEHIVDIVEHIHRNLGHAGWDATWREISSLYYGILRADVIFLLKRCPVCAWDPRKRPKGASKAETQPASPDLQSPLSRFTFVGDSCGCPEEAANTAPQSVNSDPQNILTIHDLIDDSNFDKN